MTDRGLYPAPDDEEPPVSVSQTAASLPRADAPLEPCLHCGGEAYLSHIVDYDGAEWWSVGCDNSTCSFAPYGADFDTDAEARQAWNRRDGEDARIAEVELRAEEWINEARVERDGFAIRLASALGQVEQMDARIAEAVRVALWRQRHDVFEVLRWVERHGGRVERSGIYLRGENDGDRFSSGGIGDDTFERAVIWIREQQAKERPE